MTTTHRSLLTLIVAILILTGYNFLGAAWTPAVGTPPANNTDAPINIGAVTQAKSGNLSANIFAATTQMRSNQYCDALGQNCFTPTNPGRLPNCPVGQVLTVTSTGVWGCGPAGGVTGRTDAECSAAGGTPITAGGSSICRFNAASCPAGWQQHQSWSTYTSQQCGNSCGTRCNTGALAWNNNTGAVPQCLADNGTDNRQGCQSGVTFICNAIRTQIGCY